MNAAETVRIPYAELVERLAPIFERHGCSAKVARQLAENCAAAERDGVQSHGLFRMNGYVSTLKAGGWVDGRAVPRLEDVAPGFLRIDAMNGFAVPALAAARELAVSKARACGAVVMAIRNSHHLGALSLDVEPFAERGLIALAFVNTFAAVAPHNGMRAVLGTNPIAFATPRAGAPPLVLDMATSMTAHGDVQLALREGLPLEVGVGLDSDGAPTTDPRSVLEGGALLAFGGHKGAALSLMVEVLCAALVGGKFSHEVDLARAPGASTPHTGQSFILIDPDSGRGPLPPFAQRVAALLDVVRAGGQARLPGDRRHAARADAQAHGIPVAAATLRMLDALATEGA